MWKNVYKALAVMSVRLKEKPEESCGVYKVSFRAWSKLGLLIPKHRRFW